MSPPFFSICMPVFNGEAFIERAVASLQSQTDPGWELVVVDDASTDRTWEIIQCEAARDPRIRAFRNQNNLGQAANWNECLRHARGEWLGLLPADDVYRKGVLEAVRAGVSSSGAILWIHAHESVQEDGRRHLIQPIPTACQMMMKDLARLFYLRGNVFGEMACFFARRTPALNVFGGFGIDRSTLDLDFWMRLAIANPLSGAIYSPLVLSETTVHAGADSSRYNREGRNWVDFFQFLENYSFAKWDAGTRIRQALRATYCLVRYGSKLPRGEFTRAARSVAKVIAAVFMRTRSAEWQSNKGE